MDYEKKAEDFLVRTGTTFQAKFLFYGPYFDDDKDSRGVYEITLWRNAQRYSFKFGQSIARSRGSQLQKGMNRLQPPSAYDVLSGLVKDDPGTFEDFCANYGYSNDSIKAQKTYFAVQKEYQEIKHLFRNVIGELAEIQ